MTENEPAQPKAPARSRATGARRSPTRSTRSKTPAKTAKPDEPKPPAEPVEPAPIVDPPTEPIHYAGRVWDPAELPDGARLAAEFAARAEGGVAS